MCEVEWAKAFTKRHTNVYVVVHIQKLIPHSQKSRVGVPDWHVASFHLVDVTSQILFSGSTIPIFLPFFFFFFLIRGKKCEESMSEAHSLLKTSALKWHTYVHIALKRT